jgi:ectoine hydroxylase-related dioxygenase (phytanoyl-CoA dioxygenase family)
MTLDDADVHNGAMQVLPGSHLRPLMHPQSASTNALLDLGDTVDASRAVVIDLPAGGAMLHHCQTLHYTPPNRTARQRRAFVIHFMPPGTWSAHRNEYIPVSFSSPILRMRTG